MSYCGRRGASLGIFLACGCAGVLPTATHPLTVRRARSVLRLTYVGGYRVEREEPTCIVDQEEPSGRPSRYAVVYVVYNVVCIENSPLSKKTAVGAKEDVAAERSHESSPLCAVGHALKNKPAKTSIVHTDPTHKRDVHIRGSAFGWGAR